VTSSSERPLLFLDVDGPLIPFGSPPLMRRLGILVPRDNPRAHLSRLLLDALTAVTEPASAPDDGRPRLVRKR
jgi:hypothetical protein